MSFFNQLNEAIKVFRNKGDLPTDKQAEKEMGEGYEDISTGFGVNSLGSFNTFYNKYINKQFTSEVNKIREYRNIAKFTEIADVIDDAVTESLQDDIQGYMLNYSIEDEDINKKEQVVKTIGNEFYDLFYNTLKIDENLPDWYERYWIDGRVFLELVIDKNNHKRGIINVKPLPSETMDYFWNSKTGRIDFFVQYLKPNTKFPKNREEAEKDKNIIVFEPQQILFIPFKFGRTKNSIIGYLENCKVPYNILKLLETSLIIYRIVRAPERLVFKIDVGNMPRDKGMKFVEKIKQKMNKKQSFDPNTGTLINTNEILCIRQNTEIKLLDGRSLPLTEIIKEFNEGKENWVYSINRDTLKIEPGKIANAKITRLNEKLVRVHLDDGSYIDTTYDHKFIMRNGTEKRADELKENDSLASFSTHKVTRVEYLDERGDTGCITVEGNHNFGVSFNGKSLIFLKNSVLDSYFIPQGENRGSDISTIGGNSSAFRDLDDLYYFHKKLYRALKYPISRVEKHHEGQSDDVLFRGRSLGEITRDEIKWAILLEKQQKKWTTGLSKLFLIHLEFKGVKKQYGLTTSSLRLSLNPPSDYKEQMDQAILEQRHRNYTELSREEEFSKYFLIKQYLQWDDEMIKENKEGHKKDIELGLKKEDEKGSGW